MKFAFSTVACPTWDLQTIVSRAKEWGYDGVELRTYVNEPNPTSIDLYADATKIRDAFAAGGIQIACLATSGSFRQSAQEDARQAENVRSAIKAAKAAGCGFVKVSDTVVRPGQPMDNVGVALGDWLEPLADFAAENDVTLLVENAISFRSARSLWAVLDRLMHPSLAVCWDVLNATTIKESPAVSVPTLNQRIQLVHVADAKLSGGQPTLVQLGDGEVPVKQLLIRLKGIGYKGYVTVDYRSAGAEVLLPEAVKRLREWTKPQIDPNAKPAKAAAAARPAAAAAGAATAKPAAAAAGASAVKPAAAAKPAPPAATPEAAAAAPAAAAKPVPATQAPDGQAATGDAAPTPQRVPVTEEVK